MVVEQLINKTDTNTSEGKTPSALQKLAKDYELAEQAIVLDPVYDLTLADLTTEAGQISRSNHLGNDYPSNEAFVGSLDNARFIVYDRTTGVDTNYYPWELRRRGHSTDIAYYSPDTLTPFFKPKTEFYTELDQLPDFLQEARTPAHLHYLSLKHLHPSSETFSEWLLQHSEVVSAIVNAINKSGAGIFDRQIDQAGLVSKFNNAREGDAGAAVLATAQVLTEAVTEGNTSFQGNNLLHTNELNVYLIAALDALNPTNQRVVNGETWGYVFHGSGPDMIRYIENCERAVANIHRAVMKYAPELGIPKKIYMGVVPTAELRVALPATSSPVLDELVELLQETHRLKHLVKDFRNSNEAQRKEARQKSPEIRRRVKALLCNTELSQVDFKAPFSTHASHYDAIKDGPIYFPRYFANLTFKELRELNNNFQQLKREL